MKVTNKVKAFNFFRNIFKIRLLENILATQTQNRKPQNFFCKLVPNPYQYPSPSYRTVNRNGITLSVDISDYIGHYLYFGFYDQGMDKLFSLCKENFTIIDVGANIGWTVLNLANIAKYGKVFGFEPDPFNFDRCQENLLQNNKFNCEVFPLGLGAKTGSVSMEVRTPSNRGGNRIAVSHTANNREVKIVCLDEFEPIHKLSAIDLIKMDVEGYELNVLQGAKTLLQKHKPILFIELDDNNLRDQGASALALVLFLFEVGYKKIEHAEDSSKINATTDFAHCHFDIIAR